MYKEKTSFYEYTGVSAETKEYALDAMRTLRGIRWMFTLLKRESVVVLFR